MVYWAAVGRERLGGMGELRAGDGVKARTATAFLVLLGAAQGCVFSERSYPYDPGMRVTVDPRAGAARGSLTPRQWLARAWPQLAPLLPPHSRAALLSDQLVTPEGRGVDVAAHFGIKTDRLDCLFFNFHGLAHSAQAMMSRAPARGQSPWDGFEDVWIPVDGDLQLAGKLGWARDARGVVIDADCIVIIPGILGDNNILRVRDLGAALRGSGLHVLSLELRGVGLTDRRFPTREHSWGILETDDLLIVADWLQAKPHVRRTGLVGYSWGANQAILAAWAEGRTDDEGIPPRLRRFFQRAPRGPRRFQAGVVAFSPIVRFEDVMDKMEVEQPMWLHPALACVQKTVRDRMVKKRYPNPCGNLRELIKYVGLHYAEEVADGLDYLRLLPYKGSPAYGRMGGVRTPLLLVHAANDVLVPAQEVADLLATADNPDVAAIVLPSGGHIGFGPYASAWYYNLLLSYFDPLVGVAAGGPPLARER